MKQLLQTHTKLICGIDEVGRGCLAGPMIAVAALFKGWEVGCLGVTDSKKLTAKKRDEVFKKLLHSRELVDFCVGQVSVEEINKFGIDHANVTAFSRAVDGLSTKPEYLVVDGTVGVPGWLPEFQLVVPKADADYLVCGAASILAKVIRDNYMIELDSQYPGYDWKSNKGYGTKKHVTGLETIGVTHFHRSQFISKIVPPQTGWSF